MLYFNREFQYFTVLIVIILDNDAQLVGPNFPAEWWNMVQRTKIRIEDMSYDFLNDMKFKLKEVDHIQYEYSRTASFEMGFVTGSMTDLYLHMVRIYKSCVTDMALLQGQGNEILHLQVFMDAFMVMLSDYNQIRIQGQMFKETLLRYKKLAFEKEKMRLNGTFFKSYQIRRGNLNSPGNGADDLPDSKVPVVLRPTQPTKHTSSPQNRVPTKSPNIPTKNRRVKWNPGKNYDEDISVDID